MSTWQIGTDNGTWETPVTGTLAEAWKNVHDTMACIDAHYTLTPVSETEAQVTYVDAAGSQQSETISIWAAS